VPRGFETSAHPLILGAGFQRSVLEVAAPRARWHAGALACALSRGPVPRTSPLTSELPCVQGNTQAGPMPGGKGPGLHKRQKAPAANRASSSGGMFKASAMRAAQVSEAAPKQARRTTGSGTQGDARGRTGGTAARGTGGKRTRSPSEEQLSDASQAEGTQAAGDDGAGARGEEVRVRGVVRAHTHTQLPIASTCVLRLRALPEPQLRADEVTTPCMAHASSCRCCATSLTLRHR